MGIFWTIIIGFLAGIVAKLIMPGRNEPSGFVLTTILGVVGAFLATYLGNPWVGIARMRAPVSSARWSARSSSWRSGVG